MRPTLFCLVIVLAGCSGTTTKTTDVAKKSEPAPPTYFHVDSATAGTLRGVIRFSGKKPPRKAIDMSNEPACVEAHKGKPYDESEVVNANGTLSKRIRLYQETGLEGKTFEIPTNTRDNRSAWLLVSTA